jgi:hypothetical protein
MENSNGTVGNRLRYLPASNAIPQPTAPPRAPSFPYIVLSPSKTQHFCLIILDSTLKLYINNLYAVGIPIVHVQTFLDSFIFV